MKLIKLPSSGTKFQQVIPVGWTGQNEYEEVTFDISYWKKLYPDCVVRVFYKLNTDGGLYPIADITTDTYIWKPQAADFPKPGRYSAQAIMENAPIIGKSDIFFFDIKKSLDHLNQISDDPPPEYPPSYIQKIMQDMEEYATRAEDAAEHMPYIDDGVLYIWDIDSEQFVEFSLDIDDDVEQAVERYLREHPPKVTETDPTVPEWAKQAMKPTYTADEVGALPDTTPIPTVPDMANMSDMSDWGDGKTVDAAVLKNVVDSKANQSDIPTYTTLTGNPVILRNDAEGSDVNINDLVPESGIANYQFLHSVRLKGFDTTVGYIDIGPGGFLSISAESASLVTAGGNYYVAPTDVGSTVWTGGYCPTYDDVETMLETAGQFDVVTQAQASGTIKMDDGKCINRTRAAGMTAGTIQFPAETQIDNHYRSRLNVRTASSFSKFTITARDYNIAFYGADCAGGVWDAQPSKQYQVNAVSDGFGGVIAIVSSTTGETGGGSEPFEIPITQSGDNYSTTASAEDILAHKDNCVAVANGQTITLDTVVNPSSTLAVLLFSVTTISGSDIYVDMLSINVNNGTVGIAKLDTQIKPLPAVTSADAGKFLRVDSTGTWAAEAVPSAETASFGGGS